MLQDTSRKNYLSMIFHTRKDNISQDQKQHKTIVLDRARFYSSQRHPSEY
jgi:hypothetical protein